MGSPASTYWPRLTHTVLMRFAAPSVRTERSSRQLTDTERPASRLSSAGSTLCSR